MRRAAWLVVVLASSALAADEAECKAVPGQNAGVVGVISGREISYRICDEDLPGSSAYTVWLSWVEPGERKLKDQAIAASDPCAYLPPRLAGETIELTTPYCYRFGGQPGHAIITFAFDAARRELVETKRAGTHWLEDSLARIQQVFDSGDRGGGTGLVTLLGPSIVDNEPRMPGVIELRMMVRAAHREGMARYKRGDRAGAAWISAWALTFPFPEGRQEYCEHEDMCVPVRNGWISFEPSLAPELNDLAFFIAEGAKAMPLPEMSAQSIAVAEQMLKEIARVVPDRQVAWLNLGDTAWDAGHLEDARAAYERWWALAKARGEKMPDRVRARLSPADGGE